MKKKKMLIEVDDTLHAIMKMEAAKRGLRLYELCEDFFKVGVDYNTKVMRSKSNLEVEVIKNAVDLYFEKGLMAILKVERHFTPYILLFYKNFELPVVPYSKFKDNFHALKWDFFNDSNSYYLNSISRQFEIVWSENEFIKSEVEVVLNGIK